MNIYYTFKYAIIQDQNGSPFLPQNFRPKLKQTESFGFCPNKINNHPNDLILQDYHMHVINLEEPRGNQKPQKNFGHMVNHTIKPEIFLDLLKHAFV